MKPRSPRQTGSSPTIKAPAEHDSVNLADVLNRRNFIKTSGSAAVLGALGIRAAGTPARAAETPKPTGRDLTVSDLVRLNDQSVANLRERQERRAGHRWLGGMPNEDGIHTPHGTAGLISALACASCARESQYFDAPELVEPMHLAVRYLLKAQHADGTIDLYSTNFHSTPDTAFVLEVLCPAFTIMEREAWPAQSDLRADLRKFIGRAGEALVTGGIHTTHQRWVVSAELAHVNKLVPD